MKTYEFSGILIRQVPLCNDDAILEFFTPNGLSPVFASKIAKSKKKKPELDFFRVIKVGVSEKNDKLRLKTIKAEKIFWGVTTSFPLVNQGNSILKILGQIIHEKEDCQRLFTDVMATFESIETPNIKLFWTCRCLRHLGLLPSFALGSVLHILSHENPEKAIQILKGLNEKQITETSDYLEKLEAYLLSKSMLSHSFNESGKAIYG